MWVVNVILRWVGHVHRHLPVVVFVRRRRYDALPFTPFCAWGSPSVGLTENLVEGFEVVRVPGNDIHRHTGSLAMLEVVVAIWNVLLASRATSRFARRGGHYTEGEKGYGQGTGVQAEQCGSGTGGVIVGTSIIVHREERADDFVGLRLASARHSFHYGESAGFACTVLGHEGYGDTRKSAFVKTVREHRTSAGL